MNGHMNIGICRQTCAHPVRGDQRDCGDNWCAMDGHSHQLVQNFQSEEYTSRNPTRNFNAAFIGMVVNGRSLLS